MKTLFWIVVVGFVSMLGLTIGRAFYLGATDVANARAAARPAATSVEQTQRKEWVRIAEQNEKAKELERLQSSPMFRKKVAQIALANQFPSECGTSAEIAELPNGKTYGRCSGGETFLVERGVALRCSAMPKLGMTC